MSSSRSKTTSRATSFGWARSKLNRGAKQGTVAARGLSVLPEKAGFDVLAPSSGDLATPSFDFLFLNEAEGYPGKIGTCATNGEQENGVQHATRLEP